MCTPAQPDLKQCVHLLYQILNSVYTSSTRSLTVCTVCFTRSLTMCVQCTPAQSGIGIRYPPLPPPPPYLLLRCLSSIIPAQQQNTSSYGVGEGGMRKASPGSEIISRISGIETLFGSEFDLGWARNISPNLYCRAKDFYFALFRDANNCALRNVLFCLIYIFMMQYRYMYM